VKYFTDEVKAFFGHNLVERSVAETERLISEQQGSHLAVEVAQTKAKTDPYLIYEPSPSASKVVLSVLDNGVGIKEEDQSHLYKLFGCLKETR